MSDYRCGLGGSHGASSGAETSSAHRTMGHSRFASRTEDLILLTRTNLDILEVRDISRVRKAEYYIPDFVKEGGIPHRLSAKPTLREQENPDGSIEISRDFVSAMWTLKIQRATKFSMNVSTFCTSQ